MMHTGRTVGAHSMHIRVHRVNSPARHVPDSANVFPSPKLTPTPSRSYVAGVSFYEKKTKQGHMAGGQ